MNFIGFTFVTLITFFITEFALSQILGIILFLLPNKQYITILGLLIWCVVLIAWFLVIINFLSKYITLYIVISIISAIISIFNLGNLKNEAKNK